MGLNSIEITVPLIEFSVCSAAIELNVDLKIASRPTQDYVRGKTRVYVALSINVIKHHDNFFFNCYFPLSQSIFCLFVCLFFFFLLKLQISIHNLGEEIFYLTIYVIQTYL